MQGYIIYGIIGVKFIVKDSNLYRQSSVKDYDKCAKLYKYKHVDNLAPSEEIGTNLYMDIGSCFHRGMEVGLLTQDVTVALVEAHKLYPDVFDRAKPMIEFSLYMLLEQGLTSYYYNGKPALELEFNEVVEGYNITGTIDAILVTDNNELVLVDYKSRGRFQAPTIARLDFQLYMYTWIAKHKLGIPVDKTYQIQVARKAPSKPYVDSENKVSLDATTTEGYFRDSLKHIPFVDIEHEVFRFSGRFENLSNYFLVVEYPQDRVEHNMEVFMDKVKKIDNDDDYLPLYGYGCNFCNFKSRCLSDY